MSPRMACLHIRAALLLALLHAAGSVHLSAVTRAVSSLLEPERNATAQASSNTSDGWSLGLLGQELSEPAMLLATRSLLGTLTDNSNFGGLDEDVLVNIGTNKSVASLASDFPDSEMRARNRFFAALFTVPKTFALVCVVIIIPLITCITMPLSKNPCHVTFVVVLVWLGAGIMYGFDRVDRRTWVADKLFTVQKLIANEAYQSVPFDWRNWLFFASLLAIAALNLTITIPMLVVFFQRRFYKEDLSGCDVPNLEVSIIIPCYLPNEKDIIKHTVCHILNNVDSPGKLSLWLVYNTPYDMPELEDELQRMANYDDFPVDRKLHVMRARESTSKAENLNFALPLVSGTYVAVYDADHLPMPDSLMILCQKLWHSQEKYVCVQGSTQIRFASNFSSLLGRIIDAEFFVMHFIYFPLLKELTNCTFFGGSNAVWKREVLLSLSFNKEVQTEDIDISVRALLDRGTIGTCPEARSTELPPSSMLALFRQRLRWAIGWDQVSLLYFGEVNRLPWHQRFGLLHVLYMRWIVHLSGIIVGIAVPLLGLIWHFNSANWGVSTIVVQMVLFGFYVLIAACAIIEALCEVGRRHSLQQVLFIGIFLFANSIYITFNAFVVFVSLYRICTGELGDWVVTSRDVPEIDDMSGVIPSAKGKEIAAAPRRIPTPEHAPEPEEEPSEPS